MVFASRAGNYAVRSIKKLGGAEDVYDNFITPPGRADLDLLLPRAVEILLSIKLKLVYGCHWKGKESRYLLRDGLVHILI